MIDIAADFTRYPAGRYRTDGPYSGERFRDDILLPALKESGHVVIRLDGAMGYGSSFLEEVFGGLARSEVFSVDQLLSAMSFESSDQSLIDEIREYINATRH